MAFVLGLGGAYYHDSSACIVQDGVIKSYSEEERWSRRKQNRDRRNCGCSILACLEAVGISASDIQEVAINWNPYFPSHSDVVRDRDLRQEIMGGVLDSDRFPSTWTIVDHHLSHANSSFYCSGFDESIVLVVDGSGDGISTSVWEASKRCGLRRLKAYDFQQSLGWFYETATEYVGFPSWTSAGKFMGLASYGEPTYDFSDLVSVSMLEYELKYPFSGSIKDYQSLDYYWKLKQVLFDYFARQGVERARSTHTFVPFDGLWETQTEFDQSHKNFAASVQALLEACLASLVKGGLESLRTRNVCLAGGVALNCAANGFLMEKFPEIELFVCPFANDSGGSIGAAMEVSRRSHRGFRPERLRDAGIGPQFSNDFIQRSLKRSGLCYRAHDNIPASVAEEIARGKVVGWFQGKAEAGPRALGHRSILADPRSIEVRDRINRYTKKRELWRPLCPSISADSMERFSDSLQLDDFMLVAQRASASARTEIPGAVHVDGTMRCQSVQPHVNAEYYALLQRLGETIGVPVVLNTSFNRNDEPIVGSPLDAIRTFVSSDIDVLAIGSYIATKEG